MPEICLQKFLEPIASTDQPRGDQGRPSFIERMYLWLSRHAGAVVVTGLLCFFALMAYRSHFKLIWYDEVYTALLATQPDWKHFVAAMPPEGNPPLNALLTRLFIHTFGMTPFAIRLAQMLSFTGAIAGVYVFIRRECGPMYGILGASLFFSQPVWKYAFEARPYGNLLLFFVLALLGWQEAAHALEEPKRKARILALLLIAVGVAGCILSHNIGIVTVGTPLFVGELTRAIQRRRLDWPIVVAALFGTSAMLITLPMIRRTQEILLVLVRFIEPPLTLHKLLIYLHRIKDYSYQIVDPLFLLFVTLTLLVFKVMRFRHEEVRTKSEFIPSYIVAACAGALLLLPMTWLAMIPAGGWYYTRYGMGATLGIATLVCFTLYRARATHAQILFFTAASLMHFGYSYITYKPEFPLDTSVYKVLSEKTEGPILAMDAFLFPPLWWNAPRNVKDRLFYLEGAPTLDPVNKLGLTRERPYWPMHYVELQNLSKTYDHAYLICSHNIIAFHEIVEANGFEDFPIDPSKCIYEIRRR